MFSMCDLIAFWWWHEVEREYSIYVDANARSGPDVARMLASGTVPFGIAVRGGDAPSRRRVGNLLRMRTHGDARTLT